MVRKMNVPKLRFKDFNDEYKLYKLKDLVEVYDGTHETPNYVDDGIKFVSVENISNLQETTKYITEKDYEKYKIKPRFNDVFMTRIGDIGTSTIYKGNEKLAYYVSLALLRTKNNSILLPDYLNQYIENTNFQKELHNRTIHVAFPKKINTGEIGECKCHIPNINEQTKVANFLSLLDKKIGLQSKKIEDLKLFKKGLNKILFKNCQLDYKINDLIIEFNEKTDINNQFEILSSTSKGLFLQKEYFNKQAASDNNIGYKIVPKGYITYRSMSDTGEFHFNIQNIIDKGMVSPAYPVFITKKEYVDKDYFIYFLNENKTFKNKILSSKEGGTRYALSISKLKDIKLKLPTLEEQQKYSNLLKIYNTKLFNEESKLIKLQEFKKGLMQNMFI